VALWEVADDGAVDRRRFEWRPAAVCGPCVRAAREAADAKRSAFTDGTITIQRLGEGAPPPEPDNAESSAAAAAGAKAATRPRRTGRSAGAATVVRGVGSSDRVGLLKLKAWQELGDLEPQRMELWHEGALLADDDARLDSYGVKSGAIIHARPLAKKGGRSSSSSSGQGKKRGRPSAGDAAEDAVDAVDVSDDDGDGGGGSGGGGVAASSGVGKCLEDYLAYWGSERQPSRSGGGAVASERGFSNTLLHRALAASPPHGSGSPPPPPPPPPPAPVAASGLEAGEDIPGNGGGRGGGGGGTSGGGGEGGGSARGRKKPAAKQPAKEAIKRPRNGEVIDVDDEELGPWDCTECTFTNGNPHSLQCSMCQALRPGGRVSPRKRTSGRTR
jgi:hypothetical protein